MDKPPTTIIVDIDGTLADNKHRSHHVEKSPKNWDAFNSLMHLDKPHAAVVRLVRTLHPVYIVILVTGRQECHRAETEAWLDKHHIPHNGVFMRATGDFRSDSIVKREILERDILGKVMYDLNDIWFVLDDRNSVVKMFRDVGLVVLQCADGDF